MAPKGKASKAKVVQKQPLVVKNKSTVSQEVCDYVDRLIDPDGKDPRLAPSPVPIRSTSVKTKITTDLKSRYLGTAGESLYGEVLPSLNNTLRLTALSEDPISTDEFSIHGSGIATNTWSNKEAAHMTRACDQITRAGPDGWQAWRVVCGVGSTMMLTVEHNAVGHSMDFQIKYFNSAGTEIVAINIEKIPANTPRSTGATAIDVSAYWCTILARRHATSSGTYEYQYTGTLTPGGAGFGMPVMSTLMDPISYDILSDVQDLQMYKLTTLGILGSYQGSSLADGGRVACAKVPVEWTPDENDVMSSIAKLPHDCHEGALKDGFHMHWQPSSVADLEPKKGAGDAPAFKYVFALAADDITQSFRLRLVSHVDYYSTSPSYGSMNYAPDARGLSVALEYLARTVPVCTSNDAHILKSIGKHVKSAGKTGLKYVMEHPQMLAPLLML